MLIGAYHEWTNALRARVARFTAGRFWAVKFGLLCAAVSMVYAFPSPTLVAQPPTPLWVLISAQVDAPFAARAFAPESHEAKRTFRLTMPLLGKMIPSTSVQGRRIAMIAAQYIAGVLFFALTAALFSEVCGSRLAGLAATLSFALCSVGQAFFLDLHGFFDGMAFFFLAVAMWARRPWLIGLAVFLACWVDERAIVVAALVLLWTIVRDSSGMLSWKALFVPTRPWIAVVTAVLLTIILRQTMSWAADLPVPKPWDGGLHPLQLLAADRLDRIPPGLISIKAIWLFVGLAAWALWLRRERLLLALVVASVGVFVAASFVVVDMTRTLAYVFPLAFVALRSVRRESSERFMEATCLAAVGLALFVPSFSVMSGAEWVQPLPVKLLVSPLWAKLF